MGAGHHRQGDLPMKRRERGASALFIAVGMMLFLGMAAMAVDVGSGFAERRQAQSAADFAALSAVQFSNLDSGTPPECAHPSITGDAVEFAKCRGAVEAMAVAQANLAGFTLDWATCVDPDPARAALYPELPTVLIGGVPTELECIRYSGNSVSVTLESRVVVPTLDVPTTFARVMGFQSMAVTAPAEATGEIDLRRDVLPFAIPADHSSSYECLKTGPNPDWGVCKNLGGNGNFGYLDIPTYGVPALGTTSDNCNPTNVSLVSNMVRGIDHELGEHPTGAAANPPQSNRARRDEDGIDTAVRQFVCPLTEGRANEVKVQTGVVAGDFEDGLIWGFGPGERGRLWDDSGLVVRAAGGGDPATTFDDRPLWDFLAPNPGRCPHTGNSVVDSTESMIDCIDDWDPDQLEPIIFDDAIKDAERLALAPRLWTAFGPGQWYFVEDLPPVYLDTSYFGCNATGCNIVHVPGISAGATGACPTVPTSTGSEPPDLPCGIGGPHSLNLSAITAYILDARMFTEHALAGTRGELSNLALTR